MVDFSERADIETSSDDYAQRFSGEVGRWFLKVQEEATMDMLASYSKATILDVGGGHGQLTQAFINYGHKVTILGSAESCRTRIQSFLDGDRCEFLTGNLLGLPFPDCGFDVVLSYRLLPHVISWERLISELCRVAKYAVLVDYPEERSINYFAPWLFGLKKGVEGNTRVYRCFRESELVNVFESHGFSVKERYPEFFMPMVLHRSLKSPVLSRQLEKGLRRIGLTDLWGSPVIVKLVRKGN